LTERTVTQKVKAYRKRVVSSEDEDDEDEASAAKKLLMGGQDEVDEADGPSTLVEASDEFTYQYGRKSGTTNSRGGPLAKLNPKLSYMEQLQEIEYNEKTRDQFFDQDWLVERFGYTMTFRMRIGFNRHTQCKPPPPPPLIW